MIGILLFIGFAIGLPSEAAGAEDLSQWTPYGAAMVFLVAGFLLGIVLVRTIGVAASGVAIGGLIGAVVALFNGAPIAAGGYLVTAVVGYLLSQMQAARADSVGLAR